MYMCMWRRGCVKCTCFLILKASLDVLPDENTERVRFLVWYDLCLAARMIAEEQRRCMIDFYGKLWMKKVCLKTAEDSHQPHWYFVMNQGEWQMAEWSYKE